MTHDIVLGTTELQDFQLLDDGLPLVGTGLNIGIEFRAAAADVIYTSAQVTAMAAVTVAWLDINAGTVRVSGAGGLPLGDYLVRYRLTDGGGKVGRAPNEAAADRWRVVRV